MDTVLLPGEPTTGYSLTRCSESFLHAMLRLNRAMAYIYLLWKDNVYLYQTQRHKKIARAQLTMLIRDTEIKISRVSFNLLRENT